MYEVTMNYVESFKQMFFLPWLYIKEKFLCLLISFQQKYSKVYVLIRLLVYPFWFTLMFAHQLHQSIWKKIGILHKLFLRRLYRNDQVLDEILMDKIELKQEDIEKNCQILDDVVRDRIVDYMKIADGDFKDLFQDILYGGSFYKDLKVTLPDEYDLCLMIDLSRSIDREFIEIEPDDSAAAYVKIKIGQKEFKENENFWNNVLDDDNYLNQNKFRDWIYCTLKNALKALSGRMRPEGYTVKHLENIYCISVRQKGPALTLTVIRKNNWRKIEVDLVPCLVFKNQILPGFRERKAKKWIAVAKPLKNDLLQKSEYLWRVGFQEDEKRILDGPIKPIIKLVKKLRDVQGWVHLKSYFIETVFMHELDDPVFCFFYPKCSKKMIFMYILRQLQAQLERGELLYYWHKRFNLLDRTNSLSLVETSRELKALIKIIEEEAGDEDEQFDEMFHPDDYDDSDSDFLNTALLYPLIALLLYKVYVGPTALDPYIESTSAFFKNYFPFMFSNNSTMSHSEK